MIRINDIIKFFVKYSNLSAILDSVLVTEIGLMSDSTLIGGKTLGKTVTLEIFQTSGTIPWRSEALIIAVTGAAST